MAVEVDARLNVVPAAVDDIAMPIDLGLVEEGVDAVDVVIEVYMGLDEASNELLEKAMKAAKILYDEYGVLAVVVPRVVHWDVVPSLNLTDEVPMIYVNGLVVGGVSVTIDDIIDAAFAMLGETADTESTIDSTWGPPRSIGEGAHEGLLEAALATA